MKHWSLTQPGNARVANPDSGPSLWVTDDHEYAVVVQRDWAPVVWQRDRRTHTWASRDVSHTVIGTVNNTDSHNNLVICVDAVGHIYVAGNMHQEAMRCIRSRVPHSIEEWDDVAMPGWWAGRATNLVKNPAPTDVHPASASGWSSPAGWTMAQTPTSVRTTRGAGDGTARCGVVRYGLAPGWDLPVTAGATYTAQVAVGVNASLPYGSRGRAIHIQWRAGATVLGTTNGATVPQPGPEVSDNRGRRWTARTVGVAPAGADNAVVIAEAVALGTSSPLANEQCVFHNLMFVEGQKDSDDYVDPENDPAGTGVDPAGWAWNGSPFASTSTGSIKMAGTLGADVSTYQSFERFSDGTLLWSHDQSDSVTPVGRDWLLLRLDPGATEWVNTSGAHELMATHGGLSNAADGNGASGSDDIPDRCYFRHMAVDRDDILHIVFVWRRHTSCPSTMDAPIYLRSADKGATWTTITGAPIATPFLPENLLYDVTFATPRNCAPPPAGQPVVPCAEAPPSGADASPNTDGRFIQVDGTHLVMRSHASLAIDDYGRPHLLVQQEHVWWDGSAWRREPVNARNPEVGIPSLGSVSVMRGDVHVWACGTDWVQGYNVSRAPIRPMRLGRRPVALEVPGARFRGGSTLHPAPTHAGGLEGGRPVTTLMIPDGDMPRFVRVGDGPMIPGSS